MDEVGHERVGLLGEWSMIEEGIVSRFVDQVVPEMFGKLVRELPSTGDPIQERPCFLEHILDPSANLAEVHQLSLHGDLLVIRRPPELRGSRLSEDDGGDELLIVVQHVEDSVLPQGEDFVVYIDGRAERIAHVRERINWKAYLINLTPTRSFLEGEWQIARPLRRSLWYCTST